MVWNSEETRYQIILILYKSCSKCKLTQLFAAEQCLSTWYNALIWPPPPSTCLNLWSTAFLKSTLFGCSAWSVSLVSSVDFNMDILLAGLYRHLNSKIVVLKNGTVMSLDYMVVWWRFSCFLNLCHDWITCQNAWLLS